MYYLFYQNILPTKTFYLADKKAYTGLTRGNLFYDLLLFLAKITFKISSKIVVKIPILKTITQ